MHIACAAFWHKVDLTLQCATATHRFSVLPIGKLEGGFIAATKILTPDFCQVKPGLPVLRTSALRLNCRFLVQLKHQHGKNMLVNMLLAALRLADTRNFQVQNGSQRKFQKSVKKLPALVRQKINRFSDIANVALRHLVATGIFAQYMP